MAYVGEYKDRLRDGHGSYAFPGGFFRYEGAWVKGEMHGAGVFALDDGTTYEGDFVDGEINGVGLKRWPDGSTYSGSFRYGEMHGDGVFLSATGERYDGQWRENQRNGSGELEFANKDVYRGEFRAHKPDGVGEIEYSRTGRTYDGEWSSGGRSGEGVLRDRAGARLYEGSWRNDQRHGQGVGVIDVIVTTDTETSPSSLWYEGVWERDQPEDQTTRLAVTLLSQDGNELVDMPPLLPIENKQLPPLAVVCFSKREAVDGRPARVIGENGRRVVLKIFEGQPPSLAFGAQESASVNGSASARDGDASLPSAQWQFVLYDPKAESESPATSDPTDGVVNPIDSEQAKTEDGTPQLPEERRVSEVEGGCKAGMAVFRDLCLPSATLAGSYYLVCESRTSDALGAVHVPLSVLTEGVTSSGVSQVQSAKK